MTEEVGLPPNPIHEWIRIRDEYRKIRSERGEDAEELQALREQGGRVWHESRHFIEHNAGILCRNGATQKAIDWFERRRSEPDTLPIHEPRLIELSRAGGKGRVLEQPQLLDLVMLMARQWIDIKRSVGPEKEISSRLTLLRGLASAKAVKFTPIIDQIKLGDLYHTQRRRLILTIDGDLVDWLNTMGLDQIPTPVECCIYS